MVKSSIDEKFFKKFLVIIQSVISIKNKSEIQKNERLSETTFIVGEETYLNNLP